MLEREDRWALAERCFRAIPLMADLDIQRFGQIFEH
jgi:ribonuclease D